MNKKTNIFIILSILICAVFLIIFIQNKSIYIKNFVKEQISIFQTPIPFIHKIQYFYDKAIINYLNKNKKEALKNLEISKAFIASCDIKELKDAQEIINKTITYIKNEQPFEYKNLQKNLYLNLTSIVHDYYVQSHNVITYLNSFIKKDKKTSLILQITIFLFALLVAYLYVLYNTKEEIKENALIDPLTKAYNRRSFFEDIKHLPNSTHTLVMTDIDYFKKVNDTYGHDVGDFILKEFVKIIKENIREEDKIYRWGGEEFIILLKNINSQDAYKKILAIKEKIESHDFNGIKITASFGIKEINHTPTTNDLKILDNALYISKEKGRNKVTILN